MQIATDVFSHWSFALTKQDCKMLADLEGPEVDRVAINCTQVVVLVLQNNIQVKVVLPPNNDLSKSK